MFSDKSYEIIDGMPCEFQNLKDKKFEDWEIPPWNLIINKNKLLGEGEFGKVYLADWHSTEVVAKVINDNVSKKTKDLFIKELDVLTKIHHPNVVQVMGYVSEPFIIVMEYLPNGELLKYVKNNSLSVSKKIEICLDILKALTYLHNRKPFYIIHRDIKPQNIVMSPSGRAKLADFGISRILNTNNGLHKSKSNEKMDSPIIKNQDSSELTGFVGSKRYMAPEVSKKLKYDYKIDIWSSGIIFAELFENKRYNDDFFWHKTPKTIREIITNFMLNVSPENRFTAKELIEKFETIKEERNSCFCSCLF
jgi:serine/threonine protein kinase